jgi:D-alanyl-D-alanine carboxypeptidase
LPLIRTLRLPAFAASASTILLLTGHVGMVSAGEVAVRACDTEANAPPALSRAFDDLLRQVVTGTGLGAAPGAVLSVRGPGWSYARAAGMADPDAGRGADCDMPFQIGSNTKMMTATVVLQLAEEGRLSLDDPLSAHLPGVAARLPHGEAITLRQLLQHRAGVFSYTDTAPDGTQGIAVASMSDPAARRRAVTPEEMIDFAVAHGRPLFEPGTEGQWAYSNSGYTLLGMVIEAVERLPLDKSFENRIFAPLGMTRSYLWDGIPRPAFDLPRSWLMPPYTVETTDWNVSQSWAGGGVISTTGDMHRYISALVGGELFASPGTLALMQETVPSPIPGTEGYGLGLVRIAGDVWGHGGQTLGFISAVGASAGEDVSFVAWGNSAANPVALIAPDVMGGLREAGVIAPSPSSAGP